MKYLSKILSVCLVLLMVLSMSGASGMWAEEVDNLDNRVTQEDINLALQTGVPQALSIISINPHQYGIADDSLLTLGSPFSISSILEGQTQSLNHIIYFPIISNNEIVAFTTVVKIEGKLFFGNIMDNSSDSHNKILKEDPSLQYALVSYPGESVFAFSEAGDVFPLSSGWQTDSKNITADTDTLKLLDSSKDEGNVISWDYLIASALTEDEVMSLYDPAAMSAYVAQRTSGSKIPQKYLLPGVDLYRTVGQHR